MGWSAVARSDGDDGDDDGDDGDGGFQFLLNSLDTGNHGFSERVHGKGWMSPHHGHNDDDDDDDDERRVATPRAGIAARPPSLGPRFHPLPDRNRGAVDIPRPRPPPTVPEHKKKKK